MAEKSKLQKEDELVITRVFNAPRELVFNAFTDADHMAQWWGPKGSTIKVVRFDLRPGGMFHYHLHSKEGMDMWARFVYHEIKSPELVVFSSSFSDERGGVAKAPFPGLNFPLEVMNRWTFSEKNGKTTITLHAVPHNASAEERETFTAIMASMHEGYGGTFDQLDEYLLKTIV